MNAAAPVENIWDLLGNGRGDLPVSSPVFCLDRRTLVKTGAGLPLFEASCLRLDKVRNSFIGWGNPFWALLHLTADESCIWTLVSAVGNVSALGRETEIAESLGDGL